MIRNAYLKKIEGALESLDREIGRLQVKGERAEKNLRNRYEEEIEILKRKRDVVNDKIREIRESGAGSWGELKSGAQSSLDDLKQAVDKAIAKLRKSA